ncbi:MAG: O-antigen ligase family protein [candidate division KSB1 bacterium]|nr:O-antigen ligase family protein [candidate division KSB1 bacterium]MDZ7301498.1 O-antigen ligase family protein [candidate division KSB1 bacterium]MDZ7310900.1 O-antigen ligase family protein [candidate division KSB1 bacterium]
MDKRVEIFFFFLFFAIMMVPLSMEIVPGISIYLFDFPLLLLYCCLYLRVCFRQTRLIFGAFDLVFLAFYVWLFITSLHGKDFDLSVNWLLYWVRAYLIIFYMRHTVGSFIPEKVLFFAIGFCLVVQPILAILQSITQSSIGVVKQYFGVKKEHHSAWIFYNERVTRAQGTFEHTNYLGNWLVMLVPFLQARTLDERNKFRVPFVLWWFVCATVLILTFSRANWMAFLLGVAAVVFFEHRYRNPWAGWQRWLGYLLIPAMLLVFVYTFFTTEFQLVSEMVIARIGITFADQSYDIRSDLVNGALVVMKGNLWMGVGLGNSKAMILESNPFIPKWFTATVHNIYLIVATESGVVGAVLFMIIILWPLLRILKALRRRKMEMHREGMDYLIGFIGCFVGLYFAMLWYVGMLNSCEWPLIMTLIGSALGISEQALRKPRAVVEKINYVPASRYQLAGVARW